MEIQRETVILLLISLYRNKQLGAIGNTGEIPLAHFPTAWSIIAPFPTEKAKAAF
jgi:hypothetical protein